MKKISSNKDLILVREELEKAGLKDYVGVSVYKMRNDRDKAVPHMVAKWNETFPLCVDETILYRESETSKCEEMDRYFCAELFVKGITQRAEWIKADFEDKVAYLTENQFGHPALFPAWKKKQKAIA